MAYELPYPVMGIHNQALKSAKKERVSMGNFLRAVLGAGMMCLFIGSAHATLIGDNATFTFSLSPGTTPFVAPITNTLADAPIDFTVDDPSIINGSPIFNWTVDFQGSQGRRRPHGHRC